MIIFNNNDIKMNKFLVILSNLNKYCENFLEVIAL